MSNPSLPPTSGYSEAPGKYGKNNCSKKPGSIESVWLAGTLLVSWDWRIEWVFWSTQSTCDRAATPDCPRCSIYTSLYQTYWSNAGLGHFSCTIMIRRIVLYDFPNRATPSNICLYMNYIYITLNIIW